MHMFGPNLEIVVAIMRIRWSAAGEEVAQFLTEQRLVFLHPARAEGASQVAGPPSDDTTS
jgi:hypothetical protein